MIVFDATTNHYDNGEDNAAVRTMTVWMMTARIMMARKTTARTTTTTIISMTTVRTPTEVYEDKEEERG